jgi:hypothetical protein
MSSRRARARAARRELGEAAYIGGVALVVAVAGEPRPFALIVAGLGVLTAAYIAARTLDQGDRHR